MENVLNALNEMIETICENQGLCQMCDMCVFGKTVDGTTYCTLKNLQENLEKALDK